MSHAGLFRRSPHLCRWTSDSFAREFDLYQRHGIFRVPLIGIPETAIPRLRSFNLTILGTDRPGYVWTGLHLKGSLVHIGSASLRDDNLPDDYLDLRLEGSSPVKLLFDSQCRYSGRDIRGVEEVCGVPILKASFGRIIPVYADS